MGIITPVNDKAIPNDRSTALLTDKYELTMLQAALRDGSANRQVTCEVFGRRPVSYTHLTLPTNREV